MKTVHIDYELFSEACIKTTGAWAYAAHPSTEMLCMAWAVGNAKPQLTTDIDVARGLLDVWLQDDATRIHAWNSFFELAITVNVLGVICPRVIDPAKWSDTAALAAAMGLPRALGACGDALGLSQDEQKDKRGRYLIQRLCKPNRGERIRDPELLEELYDYCRQDVIAERAIEQHLRPLNATERKVWELDQRINIRGVTVDTDAIEDALALIEQTTETLNAEVATLTGGALENVSQRQKVLDYLGDELGYPLEKFDKTTLARALEDDALPRVARRLIEIRQQLGKTSVAKYQAMRARTDRHKRIRGNMMYHGASTGRWASTGVNIQNLPRPAFRDSAPCIELMASRDAELLEAIYDEPMEALSSCLRGMIIVPEGKRLLVADYAAIEARVLAWLAGQEDVLEVFRSHGKLYEHTASQLYRVPIEQVTAKQRFIGKTAALALGYQGGVKAFQAMAEAYGTTIDAELAEQVKSDWRRANARIVRFWSDVERAAVQAVKSPGAVHTCRQVKFLRQNCRSGWLICRLPSGRGLYYYQPQLAEGKYGGEQLTYMGTNSVTRKWERQQTFGGRWVENITQAVARDLLAEAMLRIEAAGYDVVLSVHDEIIAEREFGQGSIEEFKALMCQLPSWAEGLPVAAEGFVTKRYRK